MLTRSHLALIRASLRYFAEETVPHGPAAMRPYFDDPREAAAAAAAIGPLRAFLGACELRHAPYAPAAGTVTLTPAGDDSAALAAARASGVLVATVLLPR